MSLVTEHTGLHWCISPMVWSVQHKPFQDILFDQTGGQDGQHLPCQCLSERPLRKAEYDGCAICLFKHAPIKHQLADGLRLVVS